MDRQNVGMIQRGCGARFLIEALDTGFVCDIWRQNLYRDLTMQFEVISQINDAHTTAADGRDDAIATERFAGAPFSRKLSSSFGESRMLSICLRRNSSPAQAFKTYCRRSSGGSCKAE